MSRTAAARAQHALARRAAADPAAPRRGRLARPRSRSSAFAATISGAACSIAVGDGLQRVALVGIRRAVRRCARPPSRAASVRAPSSRWSSSAQCIDGRADRSRRRSRGRLRIRAGTTCRSRRPTSASRDEVGAGDEDADSGCRGQPRRRHLGRRSPGADAVHDDRAELVARAGRRRTPPRRSASRRARRADACRGDSMSLSSTSASAPMSWPTSAARRSLSPKRISWVATVSFSFTIGRIAQPEQPLHRATSVASGASGSRGRRR